MKTFAVYMVDENGDVLRAYSASRGMILDDATTLADRKSRQYPRKIFVVGPSTAEYVTAETRPNFMHLVRMSRGQA